MGLNSKTGVDAEIFLMGERANSNPIILGEKICLKLKKKSRGVFLIFDPREIPEKLRRYADDLEIDIARVYEYQLLEGKPFVLTRASVLGSCEIALRMNRIRPYTSEGSPTEVALAFKAFVLRTINAIDQYPLKSCSTAPVFECNAPRQ
jgi:hypothetical protein